MTRKRLLTLLMALVAITWGVQTFSADKPKPKKLQQITPAERKAAAKRAAQKGLKPGVAGRSATSATTSAAKAGASATLAAEPGLAAAAAAPLPGTEGPGGVPHYFGPYGNWAYSPLPKGPVATVSIVDAGTGYTAPEVYIDDAYGTATVQATVTATFDANTGAITGFTFVGAPGGTGGGADYSAPVVTILDPTGTGATADAVIGDDQPLSSSSRSPAACASSSTLCRA